MSEKNSQEPQYLDLIQIDPEKFNEKQGEAKAKLKSELGDKAYYDVIWSDKHHPLKATRSCDYRLTDQELETLKSSGVVFKEVSKGKYDAKMSGFANHYLAIYNNDLPVFVTSDSMLYALHKFYDTFLKNIEQRKLMDNMKRLCKSLLANFRSVQPNDVLKLEYLRDLEVFFMVPAVLLDLTTELSGKGTLSDKAYNIFSIEECRKLLSEPSKERIKKENQEGYVSTRDYGLENKLASWQITEFLKYVDPKGTTRSYYERQQLEITCRTSPKLFAAVSTFKNADVTEPIEFKFGGRPLFDSIMASIASQNNLEFACCGVTITIDGTQFKPRGHYTETLELRKYFMAFTWLSQFIVCIDRKDNQVMNAVRLASLVCKFAEKGIDAIKEFTSFLSQIVGESDEHTTEQFLGLLNRHIPQDITTLQGSLTWICQNTEDLTDRILSEKNLKKGKLLKFGDKIGKEETSVSYSLIGKGVNIDNVVLQNLVDDRLDLDVETGTLRKFPSIYDVVYTVFGNNSVSDRITELSNRPSTDPRLAQRDGYKYSKALEELKEFTDSHFLHSNEKTFYSQELKMLRALLHDRKLLKEKGLFPFTEVSWEKKQAQTQSGHYSELRHDNVLYAAETYGGGCECSYPEIQIEPVLSFWKEMQTYVKMMKKFVENETQDNERRYRRERSDAEVLDNFDNILSKFILVLNSQLSGDGTIAESLKQELTCIMKIQFQGSGQTVYEGWYTKLFHKSESFEEQIPEVGSFFTGVNDERGPGGVVHLGTSKPQVMYLLMKNINNPIDVGRVFVGPVYSVHEVVTPAEHRYNDKEWGTFVESGSVKPLVF
jgi:hypothetical protein